MSPTTTTPAAGRQLQPTVLAATAVLFGVMTSHALLETARDALFLARLGPDRLAWAYLAIAGASLVAFVVMRRLLGLRDARRLLLVLVAIAAVGTSVLAATIALSHSLVFGLYVWTGLVATLAVPCFWTVVDRSLSVDQAKRYFSVIGAGGIGGALVGSAIATVLGRLVEPRHLVTAGAVSFTLTAVTAALLAPKPGTDAPVARKRADRGAMPRRTYRYIRLLVTTTLVATVALTLGDLAFKRAIAERLPAADLATTFGAIYTGLNILSLAVQLVLAPRILDRLGVGVAMVILPSLMLITTLGFAATAMLGAVLALKLGDGSLRHSLHRVTAEILYLPVAPGIRDGAKPIADALGQRGGQIVAVLVVLAATSIGSLDVGARFLAIVAAAATVVWLGLLPLVRAAYVDQFRAMLVAGGVQRGVRLPRLDASAVELLHGKLASPDEVEALAALELLAGHHAPLPALVLYHPRPAVVRRALELVGGLARSDVAPAIAHLAGHPDPDIRGAALAASALAGRDRRQLEHALLDPHPDVRAAAAIALYHDELHAAAARSCVDAMAAGTTGDRAALACAIARDPSEAMRATLGELLAHHEPEVLQEVLEVYSRAPELAELNRLLPLLEDFHVRGDVRRVLVAAGERGLDVLVAALDDPLTPIGIRRHIPRSLSRFGSIAAAGALVARLPHEPDATTELKILRALGRMRDEAPSLRIDREPLRLYLRRAVAQAARFVTLLDHLRAQPGPPTAATALLLELLDEKRVSAIERVFRTLGILRPNTDLLRVHDALTGGDHARRAVAREIAEAVVDVPLRTALFATLDELPPDERRARLGDLAPGPFRTHESLVAELLADPSESVRALAAHHAAERAAGVIDPAAGPCATSSPSTRAPPAPPCSSSTRSSASADADIASSSSTIPSPAG